MAEARQAKEEEERKMREAEEQAAAEEKRKKDEARAKELEELQVGWLPRRRRKARCFCWAMVMSHKQWNVGIGAGGGLLRLGPARWAMPPGAGFIGGAVCHCAGVWQRCHSGATPELWRTVIALVWHRSGTAGGQGRRRRPRPCRPWPTTPTILWATSHLLCTCSDLCRPARASSPAS